MQWMRFEMTQAAVDIGGLSVRPWRIAVPRSALAYGLLAPSLIFLIMFTYWPILEAIGQSLTITDFKGRAQGLGLANYQRLFADPAFAKSLVNTLAYSVGTIFPAMAIALALALALEKSTRINAVLRTLFFLPTLLPLVAAAALFMFIFLPTYGLLDHHLAMFGARATNWLGDPDLALWSIVGLTVWKNAGYYMLFFIAGLQSIPADLHEAAKIDGAGAWTRFTHVTLPLLRPTLAFVLVISTIYAVTQVDHIIVLTSGGPSDSTNIILNYIFQAAHEQRDFGRAAAATVLSVAALLALSLVSLRTLDRGSTAQV